MTTEAVKSFRRCPAYKQEAPVFATALRFKSLAQFLLLVILVPLSVVQTARAATVYVNPTFYYVGLYLVNDLRSRSIDEVYAAEQAAAQAASTPQQTLTLSNLHPNTSSGLYNGITNEYNAQLDICDSSGCRTFPEFSVIGRNPICPDVAYMGWTFDPYPTNQVFYCYFNTPNAVPPPKECKSCISDPVYASDGESEQAETDYNGSLGLNYTRTYRSNYGFFASVTSQAFIDSSLPTGTQYDQCYPGTYSLSTQGPVGYFCFPYFNFQSNLYQVQTNDGRTIQFYGPNTAVTQNADIVERAQRIILPDNSTGWRVSHDDDSSDTYTLTGLLIQKVLRGGQSFSYTYSTASTPANIAPRPGLLLSQSDPFGHTLSWQYNPAGLMSQMTNPAGAIYQYGYDANGNLNHVIYPDGSSKTYWYNESTNTSGANLPHALTGVTDESGVRYSIFQYDSSSRAIGTQLAGGVDSYAFNYTSPGTTTVVTDPLGTSRTYQFSQILSYGQDTSVTQPAASGGGTVTNNMSRDGNGNVSLDTDFNGVQTKYTYDLTRNLETSRIEAYGTPRARTIATQWNAAWRQPALITEPNRTTAFTYDSLGNVLTRTVTDTSVTPNVARTWTFTYDTYGRMLTADGPRTDVSDVTTYTYYTCTTGFECGELHTVTNAAGQTTTFNTYNAHGQPLTITDPNGVVTTLTYDGRQRLTSRQTAGETAVLDYWPTGLLKKVTLPDASYLAYTYDGAHRLTQVTDALGNRTVYTLDAMGNRTAENTYDPTSALHRTHTRVINTLNQLWKDVNAAGTAAVTTTFGYDANGNQTTTAAPLARNTTNIYDELNRLKQITDPGTGVTQFGYDANDNLTSVTDPRTLVTSYTYTGFGDLKTQASPDAGNTTSTYDSAGNLATSTDARSAVSTYAYDALNRVTSVVYSQGGTTDQTINFTYDTGTNGKGHLTGASDANHSLTWSYDALGRVTNKSQIIGGVTKSVGYGYSSGNLTTLTTPSGQTVTYGYNGNHQVTSVAVNGTTVLNSVTYEPLGPVSGWAWGNSTTTTRIYDTDGKISQIVSAGTKTYSYDDAFRITGLTDTSPGAASWTYGYDALDRLTSGTSPSTTRGWTYDANGNRLTETGSAASTYTIAPSSNRISGITGALARTYAYDNAGNTTGYSTVTATYNNAGRLKTLANGGSTETAIYNALGQRIQISGGVNGTVLYAYDEAGHLVGEYDGTGALIEETVWLGDIPIATLRPSGVTVAIYYVHSDQLNTPRQVTRPSDNVAMWTWNSDPFGTDAANANPAGAGTFAYNLRFPGQVFDGQAGLHYNGFRDFDPANGRYAQSDPIGIDGGINTYTYVNGAPNLRIDPFGLAASDVAAILQHIGQNFPEIHPQGGWGFGDPGPENEAYAEPMSGKIVVDNRYAKACLTNDEFITLYFNVLHEAMHSTDSRLQRAWDNIVDFWGFGPTANHDRIANRETYEQYGLATPHMDKNGLWGYGDWDNWRPAIAPQLPGLYEKTRPRSCECNR